MQELLEEDLEFFQKELGLKGVYQIFSYWNSPSYPGFMGKRQGVAIFAEGIVDSGAVFYTGKEENILKSFDEYISNESFQENRALVCVDVSDSSGNIFRFVSVQLPVTSKGESTPYQLEVIDLLTRELNKLGEFILCGDMNAPRGNESFTRLARNYRLYIFFS